ncbi:MAG: EF-hand domain-containing protein [archaeon]|nr:EF-hand domain-containing protein [archaeon]
MAVKKSKEEIAQMIETIFKGADSNKNGLIERKEFHNLMVQFNKKLDLPEPTEQETKELMAMFDFNSNGVLEFEEFKSLAKEMLKTMNVI